MGERLLQVFDSFDPLIEDADLSCLPLSTDRDRQTCCGHHDSDPWQPIGEGHGHAFTLSTEASAATTLPARSAEPSVLAPCRCLPAVRLPRSAGAARAVVSIAPPEVRLGQGAWPDPAIRRGRVANRLWRARALAP